MPVAERGVLDLSEWDVARDGPIALNGQWEFYWDQLLAPDAFKSDIAPPQPSGFMNLPGTWKDQELEGKALPGQGQATFRLRLLPGPENLQLALRLISIHAAYRLWANGKLVAQSGELGRSSATETPHRSLVLARVASQGKPIDLVLQVSNHAFRRGGLLYPVLLGLPDQLELIHSRIWSWGMFFVGSLLIMIVYHLVLYFLKRKESSTLYFSLDCLLLICYYVTSDPSDWLINLFIPNMNSGILQKISVISYPVMSSVVYRFYRSLYPVDFLRFIQNLCDLRNIAFVLIVLTQSNIVIYTALYWLALSTVLLNCYFLVMLIICVRRGRDGASFLLLGYLSFSAATLSEIYGHIISFFEGSILLFGFLAFVLFQALAMAQRFANAFTAVENLSADLRTEMDERTRLEREIVNVSEEERRRLSHDLHDGLCQQLVGTRVRCAALTRRQIAEHDVEAEVAAIASLLTDSVGQAYDLSRGLWPVELDPGQVEASLAELARRVSRASGIVIQFCGNLPCSPCRNEHLVQLYRIAQEAVANAVKHAKPSRITISLGCGPDRQLTLAVRDNGIGHRTAARTSGGLGLRMMAYRARTIGASLSIDDAEDGGTRVVCSLACPADKTSEDADG
ncbi:MAG: signal transduction histidine kinase [Solidesulfovibrio magneticus str. Maddingley MBC34]|uniref:histidine kinase n=1 Tax=Solidesulfovibrio magneticus str. Maddingley MBC34 TaxID=1206767 RepID=K6FNU1_9BACT|nr:MAG: signal transduction histidine kinase [Solidesulfovibrio magneticus str. Maddingley MBC34]